MAYSEELAHRVRAALGERAGVREQKMFGGIVFMLAGNMCCGIIGDDLMVRLGKEGADAALDEPHTRPMAFTGRTMGSMVFVDPAGTRTDAALGAWVSRGVDFAETLPPK